jgi:hypothetical protein
MALLTVVLMPLILVTLVGVLELGFVRLVAERARIAADLATVIAVNDQDDAELARTGRLRPAVDAADVARAAFAVGLETIAGSLASTPEAIAASADVSVLEQGGAVDPRTGRTRSAPTVRISADLPIRTPVFAALLARPVTVVQLWSAGSPR